VMAIVTYILLNALHRGLEKNFNPKVLVTVIVRLFRVLTSKLLDIG
jgi:hypothetical protein